MNAAPESTTESAKDSQAEYPSSRTDRSEKFIARMAIFLALVLTVYAIFTSLSAWRSERAAYIAEFETVSELEGRAIDAFFRNIEQALDVVSEQIAALGPAANLDLMQPLLSQMTRDHAEYVSVTLRDPTGKLLLSDDTKSRTARGTLADAISFKDSVDELKRGRRHAVGLPFVDAVGKSTYFPVRTAVRNSKGDILYVLSVNLPHEYLRAFWADTLNGKQAAIGIVRDNGQLLSRYPTPPNATVSMLYHQPRSGELVRHLREGNYPARGTVEGASSLDGPDFLTVYRRLIHHELTLFVTVPMSQIRATWWQGIWPLYALLLLVAVSGSVFFWRMARAQKVWRTSKDAAEKALLASERRWKFALEGAREGVWDWDLKTNTVLVSRLYEEIFGTHGALTEKSMGNWTDRIHPLDRDVAIRKYQAMMDGKATHYDDEHREQCADGTWKWVHVRSRIVERDASGAPSRMIGTIGDVTARRAKEDQLRLLEKSIERINDIILITEAEPFEAPGPRILYVNEAFVRRTGYTREEVIGKTPRLLQGPLTDRAALDRVNAGLRRWESVREELINYTKSGETFWLDMEIVPIADETGWYTHWVAIERDVTERKRNEAALQESEQRFRIAIEALQEGFVLQNKDAEILVCNQSAERILGLNPTQMMWRAPAPSGWRAMRADGSHFPREQQPDLVTLRTGEPQRNVVMGIEFSSGARTWITINSVPIFGSPAAEPTGVVTTFADITERIDAENAHAGLEAQLREVQKLDALGTLAGGIAHDFNNILGAILGNLSLAREDVGDNPAAQQSLSEIAKAGNRAKTLVDQILTFSRRQSQELTSQALQPLVHEAIALLKATLPASAALECHMPTELLYARCNASQMTQLLINLCTNSWHALPNSVGLISVELSRVTVATDIAAQEQALPVGQHIRLRVQDNGCGMDAETQARIFEPFFTTKPVGQGTGLGLPVVHGIVKASGGTVKVDSTPGSGTTFDVYLPATGMESAAATAAEDDAKNLSGNGQRVVYIDDDEAMLMLVVRMLEKRGFNVRGFASGAIAIAEMQRDPHAFDLVVTDFNMPGPSGLDVAHAVKALRADLPIIIASGYISEELRKSAQEIGVRDIVYKPNTVEELALTIVRSLQ